jgi:sulfur-oxidizing protein SoxY
VGWGVAAKADPGAMDAALAKFTGGKTVAKGKIAIELPEVADNGNTIPLSIAVESPMTAGDHVSEVLVLAEENPAPEVVKFGFTPLSGKAEVSTRIRLAKSQNVIVVARTNKGELFTSRRFVKVTVGGCVG